MAGLNTPVALPAGCISAMNLQRPPRGYYGGYGTRLPANLRAAPHFTHALLTWRRSPSQQSDSSPPLHSTLIAQTKSCMIKNVNVLLTFLVIVLHYKWHMVNPATFKCFESVVIFLINMRMLISHICSMSSVSPVLLYCVILAVYNANYFQENIKALSVLVHISTHSVSEEGAGHKCLVSSLKKKKTP